MDVRQIFAVVASLTHAADVVSGWLATYALHSTAWILLAWWLATRRALRLAPRTQHTVWTVALLAGFATTTVQLTAVQLAGSFRPLAGQLRLLDGARGGRAPFQLLVRRDADQHTHFSFGASSAPSLAELGFRPPVGAGQKEVRIVHIAKNDVALRTPVVRQQVRAVAAPGQRALSVSVTAPLAPLALPVSGAQGPFYLSSPPGALGAALGTTRGARTIQAAFFAAPWSVAIVALWAVGAALLFLRLRIARTRLDRMLSDREDARHTMAGSALRELGRIAGVPRDVPLSVTHRFATPAAIPGGEICLPRRVLTELTLLEQESLLAHELAHVVRRDTTWLWIARLVECVAWFQPLNRLASRRMQLAAEFAADEWAARVTHQPLRLAKCLARVAGWLTPGSAVLSPAMAESSGSPLVQRVRRLTGVAGPVAGAGRGRMTGFALAMAAVGLVTLPPRVVVGREVGMPGSVAGARDRKIAILVRRDDVQARLGVPGLQAQRGDSLRFDVLRFVQTSLD